MDNTHIKPPGEPVEQLNESDLKQDINNLLWRYLPDDTTLGFADKLACRWYDAIKSLYEKRIE